MASESRVEPPCPQSGRGLVRADYKFSTESVTTAGPWHTPVRFLWVSSFVRVVGWFCGRPCSMEGRWRRQQEGDLQGLRRPAPHERTGHHAHHHFVVGAIFDRWSTTTSSRRLLSSRNAKRGAICSQVVEGTIDSKTRLVASFLCSTTSTRDSMLFGEWRIFTILEETKVDVLSIVTLEVGMR